MISYLTSVINDPWDYADIQKYELEGSQRDSIIYNSVYDSRITLTEENIYLCSVRTMRGEYKNFYLYAITRSLFYFVIYIPQMDVIEKVKNHDFTKQWLPRFKLLYDSQYKNSSLNPNDDIVFPGGSCVLIKVNANVAEFLFPRYKCITNEEIKKKYSLMNALYCQFIKEYEVFGDLAEKYNAVIEAHIERHNQIIKKILIKKGIRLAISSGIALATGGILMDWDALFGISDLADLSEIGDLADVADIADMADIDFESLDYWDLADNLQYEDIDTDYICESYADVADPYNISFRGDTITVHQDGNLSRTIKLSVEKIPGTSHRWEVKKGSKVIAVIDSLRNGKFYVPGFGTAVL